MLNHTDFFKYVYHFTSANTALSYILPSQTLKLASISSRNDPKDSNFETFHKGLWAKVNLENRM